MQITMPTGLFGIAIPLNSDMQKKMYPKNEHLYIEHVMRAIEPDKSYYWSSDKHTAHPDQFVTLRPPEEHATFSAMKAWPTEQLSPNGQAWLIGTEPNGWEYGSLTTKQFMGYVNEVYADFGTLLSVGIDSYAFIAPNSNINGVNMPWLKEFWEAATNSAKALDMGIHVWGKWEKGMVLHWNNFLKWFAATGEKGFYVTEAGPGGNATDREMVTWFEGVEKYMFPVNQLHGLFVTAATHTWRDNEWGGLLDENGQLTAFGLKWMEARVRWRERNDALLAMD